MPTNDERRDIAARLRFTDHNMTWSEGCFCIADDVGAAPTGNEHDDVLAFAHALADLIDRPTATATMDYEAMEDGIPDCRIWTCNECKESFPVYRGFYPTYCPVCGMEIKK